MMFQLTFIFRLVPVLTFLEVSFAGEGVMYSMLDQGPNLRWPFCM